MPRMRDTDIAMGLDEIGKLCEECLVPNLLVVEPELIKFDCMAYRELVAFDLSLDLLLSLIRSKLIISQYHGLYEDLRGSINIAKSLIEDEMAKRGSPPVVNTFH